MSKRTNGLPWSRRDRLVRSVGPAARLKDAIVVLLLLLLAGGSRAVAAVEPPGGEEQRTLTLDSAVDRALHFNRSIRDAEFAVASSELGVGAARALFDTKIRPLSSVNYSSGSGSEVTVWEVGGAVSKIFTSGARVELRPSVSYGDAEYDAGIGFSVAVPLLRGFGSESVLNEVYANEFAHATSLRNVHRQRVNVLLETVSAVYSAVKEGELIDLYQQQLGDLRDHLRVAAVKERVGLARSMDLYRVEIRIKEVEDALSLARERLANVTDQLKSILALPLEQPISVTAPLLYSFIDIDRDEAIAAALAKRIEIRQAVADVEEAHRKSRVAALDVQPELDLRAEYTRRGSSGEFERSFVFDEDVFLIGLSSDTDFARSAEKSRLAQSRIGVKRERLQYVSTQEDVTREVRRVLNGLEKSRERIHLRREQIVQAAGKQRLARVKFEHGEADNFDLIESQSELQRARANLVADEIQYIIDGYRLRGAMGTLLEYGGR